MKVIIAGDHKIKEDPDMMEKAIKLSGFKITKVLDGGAAGADRMGRNYALKYGIPYQTYDADWNNLDAPNARIKTNEWGKEYNANAGFDRNQEMVDDAEALILLQPNGESPGSQDCLRRAKKKGIKYYVYGQKQEVESKSDGEFEYIL